MLHKRINAEQNQYGAIVQKNDFVQKQSIRYGKWEGDDETT